MHWTYSEADSNQLHQGDVLQRTSELDALLAEVHPYFHKRADNLFFMVLTQTCDLVRRPTAKTDYIAICPVRPLERILSRAMKQYVAQSAAGIPVGTQKDQQKFRDFLARLFNNNESGLFYLEGEGRLGQDCCALTRLSISLRAGEHYEKCLNAKVLQLSEQFEAKLGWSIGNIYSRVGTQDWENKALQAKITGALGTTIVWVNDDAERQKLLPQLDFAFQDGKLDDKEVLRLQKSLGSKKDDLVALVSKLMADVGVEDEKQRKIERRLASDPALKQLVRP